MDNANQDSIKDDVEKEKENVRNMIKATIAKMGPNFTKEEKQAHGKVLVKIFEQGMPPKEAMNISEKEIAEMYSFAYSLFSSGKYLESSEMFKMLLMIDPDQSDFATALGVCYHRMKEYKKALDAYMLAGILAPKNPVPMFYAYDCAINIDEIMSAGMMLSSVIKRAGNQPQYNKIKERAEILLDALEKEIVAKTTQ